MCTKIVSNHSIGKPSLYNCQKDGANSGKKAASLDTLAQLTNFHEKERKTYINRQKAKAITNAQIYRLIDLNSDLKKSYWNSWHCSRELHHVGHKITSKYCNNRWCNVCNRIRMAKMINAYSIPLLKHKDLHFVTLTAPNVKGHDLSEEITKMGKIWRKIAQSINYYDGEVAGLRKLECTYNSKSDTYNPHFHILVSSKKLGDLILSNWMKHTPGASLKAQDIRKADSNSLLELFKYTAKGVHKGKFYAMASDTIYQALRNRRTYQPFGTLKKHDVGEDIEDLQAEITTYKGDRYTVWEWCTDSLNWIDINTGELLTDHIIEGKLEDWINDIGQPRDEDIPDLQKDRVTYERIKVNRDDVEPPISQNPFFLLQKNLEKELLEKEYEGLPPVIKYLLKRDELINTS